MQRKSVMNIRKASVRLYKMKQGKRIIEIMPVLVFAYIYAHGVSTDKTFDLETFCVLLFLIAYMVVFFRFLFKLFSR